MLATLLQLTLLSSPHCSIYDMHRAWLLRVIDGDTFELNVDLGLGVSRAVTTRLLDFDTPEMRGKDKARGKQAKKAAKDWIVAQQKASLGRGESGYVTFCATGETGKYGRLLVSMPGLVDYLERRGLRK